MLASVHIDSLLLLSLSHHYLYNISFCIFCVYTNNHEHLWYTMDLNNTHNHKPHETSTTTTTATLTTTK